MIVLMEELLPLYHSIQANVDQILILGFYFLINLFFHFLVNLFHFIFFNLLLFYFCNLLLVFTASSDSHDYCRNFKLVFNYFYYFLHHNIFHVFLILFCHNNYYSIQVPIYYKANEKNHYYDNFNFSLL